MDSIRTGIVLSFCLVSLALLGGEAMGSLAAYYNFDNADATDWSGHGNDGTLTGSALPTFSGDVPAAIGGGMSIQFNNSGVTSNGSRVEVPHAPSLAINDTITIAYWLRADAADQPNDFTRTLGKNGGGTTDPGWEYQRSGGSSNVGVRIDTSASGNQIVGNVPAFDGGWHHVAHVLDNGSFQAYFDGALVGSGSYTHDGGFGNTRTLTLGTQDGGGRPLNGLMDDVSVWNEPLNQTQVGLLASGFSADQLNDAVSTKFTPNADAYVQGFGPNSAQGSNFGDAELLQVKNQGASTNEFNRKAYVRFDVSNLGGTLVDAEFSLMIPDPAFGAGSNGNLDWNFQVFGLDDGFGEDWIETGAGGINWINAPANDTDSPNGVTANAAMLGLFAPTITGRGDGEMLTLTGQPLIDFLNADNDGLVTFIVTRVEPENSSNTVVHAFGSRENPDAALHPMLTLETLPVPEPTTAGLALLAAGALLRRRRRTA